LTSGPEIYLIHLVAQIAQSVEQRIENPRVGGSTPSLGTKTPTNPKEQWFLGVFYCLRFNGFWTISGPGRFSGVGDGWSG
jgi:hypothetical protein